MSIDERALIDLLDSLDREYGADTMTIKDPLERIKALVKGAHDAGADSKPKKKQLKARIYGLEGQMHKQYRENLALKRQIVTMTELQPAETINEMRRLIEQFDKEVDRRARLIKVDVPPEESDQSGQTRMDVP